MSKSGSSAGGQSGAGRRGKVARGSRNTNSPALNAARNQSPKVHAATRRRAEFTPLNGPAPGAPAPVAKAKPAKSGNQKRKVAQAARAIAKKKAKKRG